MAIPTASPSTTTTAGASGSSGHARRELVVRLALQHDIDVARRRLPGRLQWRGAEHLAPVETARVVTEDRQRIAGNEASDRREVDLLALDASGGGIIALDAPLVVKQIDLDARIDCHQLAEQLPLGEISAVVLGTHHEMAKGVLLCLQEKDVRWPDDLSLVLIGTPEWSDLLRPSLACVKRPESEMGGAAASLLLEKLKNPTHRRTKQVLPTRFIEGRSVRFVNGS